MPNMGSVLVDLDKRIAKFDDGDSLTIPDVIYVAESHPLHGESWDLSVTANGKTVACRIAAGSRRFMLEQGIKRFLEWVKCQKSLMAESLEV